MTPTDISIFLCDDVPELRTLLRYMLTEHDDLHVVGEAGDAKTGIARIGELRPDIVLLDLSMPGMDGLEAIPRIIEVSPETGIVVFSGFAAERMSQSALSLGADRYVEKGDSIDEVRDVVREVYAARHAA